MTDALLRRYLGGVAIGAATMHSLTDAMELMSGGFSTPQLALNYLAFLAMPFVAIGVFVAQRPRSAHLGLLGAVLYGASFVYFAGTSVVAFTARTPDYADLLQELGGIYTAHGALMVVGGWLFGASVVKAGVLPRWTGFTLMVGVTVNLVVTLAALPPAAQTLGSAVRNMAFVGMGVALMRGAWPR